MKMIPSLLLALMLCMLGSAAFAESAVLPDGQYWAEFDADGSMFHVNETMEGKGMLTVQDGQMTIHLVMPSKNILNLFLGTADEARMDGALLVEPTIEEVTYPDGYTEKVYAFDLPVPVLDAEFDCAIVGKKAKWYDHKVVVRNPQPVVQCIDVTISGGSGRASVASPALLYRENDGYVAKIVWSSSNYEFMLINGVQYDPVSFEGGSTFLIPIVLDEDMAVSAQTVAMSTPHLIDYTLHFDSSTIE